jgi:hypothetical protein
MRLTCDEGGENSIDLQRITALGGHGERVVNRVTLPRLIVYVGVVLAKTRFVDARHVLLHRL